MVSLSLPASSGPRRQGEGRRLASKPKHHGVKKNLETYACTDYILPCIETKVALWDLIQCDIKNLNFQGQTGGHFEPNRILLSVPKNCCWQIAPHKRMWSQLLTGKETRVHKQLELHQTMEGFSQEHVIGIPLASFAYADEKTQRKTSCSALVHKKNKKNSIIYRMSKLRQKSDSYLQGFKEHITLGPKISETVKGKLRLGAKVLQAGGINKVFRQYFPVEKDEKLLKAFQCYLSTTAGPIAGMLFISTEKIAFHSDRPLDLTSPKGGITRVPYKVFIPAKRIKSAAVRENLHNPDEKYIDVVTVDGFDFWFMGFISYTKSFKYLQHVISELR